MLDTDDSFIKEYLAESREHLADIESDLLQIEADRSNVDEKLVNKVFRAAHSIKGGAGFFNLHKIQELAHRTENALDMIRAGELTPAPDVINILLLAFDRLRELLNQHETSHQSDNTDILTALAGMISANLEPGEKESLNRIVDVTAPGVRTILHIPEFDLHHAEADGCYLYLIEYDLIDDIQRQGKRPLEVFYLLSNSGTILEAVVEIDEAGTLDDEPADHLPFVLLFSTELGPSMASIVSGLPMDQIHIIHEPLDNKPHPDTPKIEEEKRAGIYPAQRSASAILSEDVPPVGASLAPQSGTSEGASTSSGNESTLRVDVNLLESLMNLAGELVLSRNQLLDALASGDQHTMKIGAQRINLVTSELQETIMLTRMQPVGNIFNKFPRIVRDLSKELGKEIRLEISGRDVEMDKTIIEGLSEPITHMIRNAVDHGIESRDVRIRAGKPAFGTIQLKAYHEAGQVVVEVRDDGRGIDPSNIAAAALTKGLVTQEHVKGMSQKEMTSLIFLPGLSTSESVNDISGRGVGMDVVKTNLDKLGGKVEIETVAGEGTNFIIRLPLTLAIIPSLLLSVNGERFALPQVHVSELIHIAADQIRKRIEVVGNAEVLMLRGSLIPLIRLTEVLEMETEPRPHRGAAASGLNIVVITTGALKYGLIVDTLHDTVEIVVKPLGRHLQGLREYAGATILGDGNVALILDATGIATQRALIKMAGNRRDATTETQVSREEAGDYHSLLAFRNAPHEYCAVPLDQVVRVLQVGNDQIEWAGGRRTMQYRGSSLPLVTLRDTANVSELEPDQEKAVVIFNVFGRELGLLAGMPADVMDASITIDKETLQQTGVLGSAVIDGNTTLILDIPEIVTTMHPSWVTSDGPAFEATTGSGDLVLLAEDSDFFRGQVRRCLESAGYSVIAAADGQEAWDLLNANPDKVRLVLTDIEMPNLDGLELTRTIRTDRRFSGLPVIALTSLASEEDQAHGLAAGVNDYHVKLDREKLLETVGNMLRNENNRHPPEPDFQ
jgi:two-component system, chemotaxis family, sensor kinase CheA